MRRLGRCRHCRRYIARDASRCPFCETTASQGVLGSHGSAVARALSGALALSLSAGCGPAAAPPVEPALIEPEPEPEPEPVVEVDSDQDGIFDANDACPLAPEDHDGIQDDDGCPDPDNDGDGIADVDDMCPLDVEIINGFEDTDGCPDDDGTRVRMPVVRVENEVFFKSRSSDILPSSRPLLTEIAGVLVAAPQYRITLEGHTDDRERSSARRRQRLSEKRAEAVRDTLVELGVDAERLEVVGYGDTRPIADNETDAGRALNRRVKFELLSDE